MLLQAAAHPAVTPSLDMLRENSLSSSHMDNTAFSTSAHGNSDNASKGPGPGAIVSSSSRNTSKDNAVQINGSVADQILNMNM